MKELKLALNKLGLNEHQVDTILNADLDHSTLLDDITSNVLDKERAIGIVIGINLKSLDNEIKEIISTKGWAVMGVPGEDSFAYTIGLHEKCVIELLADSQVSTDSQTRVLNHIAELLNSHTELQYDKVVNLKGYHIVTGYNEDGSSKTEALKIVLMDEGPLDYDRLPLNYISRIYPNTTPNIVRVYIADELNLLPLEAMTHLETVRRINADIKNGRSNT